MKPISPLLILISLVSLFSLFDSHGAEFVAVQRGRCRIEGKLPAYLKTLNSGPGETVLNEVTPLGNCLQVAVATLASGVNWTGISAFNSVHLSFTPTRSPDITLLTSLQFTSNPLTTVDSKQAISHCHLEAVQKTSFSIEFSNSSTMQGLSESSCIGQALSKMPAGEGFNLRIRGIFPTQPPADAGAILIKGEIRHHPVAQTPRTDEGPEFKATCTIPTLPELIDRFGAPSVYDQVLPVGTPGVSTQFQDHIRSAKIALTPGAGQSTVAHRAWQKLIFADCVLQKLTVFKDPSLIDAYQYFSAQGDLRNFVEWLEAQTH